jgi:hypothetical protein
MRIQSKSPVFIFVMAITLTCSDFVFAAEFSDLKNVNDIPKETFLTVQQSSVRFQILGGSSCTGTWVSNDGLMLTALHCLESCLSYPENDGSRPIETSFVQYPQLELGFPFSLPIRKFLKEKAYSRVCKVESGTYGISSNLGAQLVFTPAQGWIDPYAAKFLRKNDMAFLQKLRSEKLSGIGDESDIALIKIAPVDSNKPLFLPEYFSWPANCTKVRFEKLIDDETIFSISYPAINRLNKVSNYKPQFTDGKVLKVADQSKPVSNFLEVNFPGNNFIVSTLDAESGSSGSGIFDIQGYIRGVTFLGLGPTTHYVSGRTVSLPLSDYFEEMPLNIKLLLCQ